VPHLMTLRLMNDSKPIKDSRWRWAVWVEGPAQELDQVKVVRYTLHPTFPDPVRTVTDRGSKFRLESSGWGEFSIMAHLTLTDDRVESLERWIRLQGREEEPGDVSRRRPRVFLSGSGIDRSFLSLVREELHKQDVDVITSDDVSISAASSASESSSNAVSSSDVVAVVLSRGYANTAQHDVAMARARQKIVVPVLLGPNATTPSALADLEFVHAESEGQSSKVADLLASRAKDAFFA